MQLFIRGISIYTTCNTQTINDVEPTDSIRTLYLNFIITSPLSRFKNRQTTTNSNFFNSVYI